MLREVSLIPLSVGTQPTEQHYRAQSRREGDNGVRTRQMRTFITIGLPEVHTQRTRRTTFKVLCRLRRLLEYTAVHRENKSYENLRPTTRQNKRPARVTWQRSSRMVGNRPQGAQASAHACCANEATKRYQKRHPFLPAYTISYPTFIPRNASDDRQRRGYNGDR